MILLMLGEKGGCGKSTLATNLAGMRAQTSDVAIVDADRQATTSYWVNEREKRGGLPVPVCVQAFGRSLKRTVMYLARNHDDVLIDVSAGKSAEARAALELAHRAIVPVLATGPDICTIGDLEETIEDAMIVNPDLESYVVINRANPSVRGKDVAVAQSALMEMDVARLAEGVVLHQRMSFQRAIARGFTVGEYLPPDPKAMEEMQAVYELAFRARRPAYLRIMRSQGG